jgi:hypothetical protein
MDRSPPLCPSALPGMSGSRVLALAGDAALSEVFRFTAPCAASACSHFDGHGCRLAAKIVETVSYRATALSSCVIRRDCRWHAQEGMAACLVCPLLLSETADLSPNPSPELAYAANPSL